MKKTTITLMTLIIVALVSATVHALPPRNCGSCWNTFKKLGDYRTLPMKRVSADKYSVTLSGIRSALEKAGINEPVSIELHYDNKLLGKMGSYRPTIKNEGSGDGIPVFSSMGSSKTFQLPSSLQGFPDKGKVSGTLVVKDSAGKVKARVDVQYRM